MMRRGFTAVLFLLVLLIAAGAFAQATTGNLTGTVTQAGTNLPGVTVTISSPSLQGTRTAVTNENGDYSIPSIPPGTYKVTFGLSGMQDVTKTAQVNLTQTTRLDADMKMSAVSESITVTANQATVMETPQVEHNMKQETVAHLPMNRTPISVTGLAPGVTTATSTGSPSISGAFSYDNLYVVDGAVVNENLRGQPQNLFIEDAIEETTVLTGAISAEYGRFTGGVVSALTRSGGNQYSGSFRTSLSNPAWTALSTPTQPKNTSELDKVYEETIGGRIIRDRLWFFLAGRQSNIGTQRTLNAVATGATLPGYVNGLNVHRLETKATAAITQKQNIVLSYIRNNTLETNNCQFGCLDFTSIDPSRSLPNNFKTAHYSGTFGSNLLIEGDWAKRYFAFVGSGADFPRGATTAHDLALGTNATDQVVTGASFNSPVFCGTCTPETRNNKDLELKGRYFLGTHSLGTHNMVVGVDRWAEQRLSNNYQSATDFRFDILNKPPVQNADGTVNISIVGSATTGDRFVWFPIQYASLGSNLKTNSVFANDKWDLNSHLSFNIGARWDKNDATDSLGNNVSSDKAISPRLGAIFDAFGNGRLRFDVNYGKYVGRLAETQAGLGSAGGSPATYVFRYAGPDIPYMPAAQALEQAFTWFLANGFTNRAPSQNPSIPGFNRRLAGSLKSPDMREITVGTGGNIGKGYLRADYIDRKWENFYVQTVSLQQGTVPNPANPALKSDLILVQNAFGGLPQRTYKGVQLQGQYQLPYGIGVGGNYTYSKLRGNAEGETSGGGPASYTSRYFQYPEYQDFVQNSPIGYLSADQRHKLRVWGTDTVGTRIGSFNFGVIERYDSGTPYSISGSIPIRQASNFPTGIVNPGYAAPPTTVGYFFSGRGDLRWDPLRATDLSLQYELPIHTVRLFAKAEVRNVFNHIAVLSGDTTVYTAANSGKGLLPFNPFTDTPKQCPATSSAAECTAMGANYQLSKTFGQPLTATTNGQAGDYQLPRTYLGSVGFRF